jgi:hypothetical protein
MEENRNGKIEGDVPSPRIIPFSEKLENFWYHYKWHTVAVVVALVLVLVCALQMCSRESFDAHIIYAGDYELSHTSKDGDLPSYNMAVSSLNKISGDLDKDGKASVNLKDLFILLSEEKIKELEKDTGKEVNTAFILENKNTFEDLLTTSYDKYYFMLVSKEVYESTKTISEYAVYADLTEYTEGTDAVMYDASAIYLNSTAAKELSGLSKLPSDTLIVIKKVSPMAEHWNKKGSAKAYENAVKMLENLLNYD